MAQTETGSDFGVVGLGVMGANIALNIEERGFSVSVFNRSPDKIHHFMEQAKGRRFEAAKSWADLASSLRPPRRILLMLQAGPAVDEALEALVPHLRRGDIVIDGGNEFFTNTERRARALALQGIEFVGMGVSGGETGARHGPSIMPGGTRGAYAAIEDVLVAIAAKVEDGPCVTYIGSGGAGHYVKMVHNGIEYGDMQLIAEIYDVLKQVGGLTNSELASVFSRWNQSELESYLIEITSHIFRQKDELTGQDLVDMILDSAKMKGTGSWTVKDAAELGVPIPTISSAVDARIMSSAKTLREKGATLLAGPEPQTVSDEQKHALIEEAQAALYAAKACSYAQGIWLLEMASRARSWNLDIAEIARIWKGGCIIRAAFLRRIQEAYRAQEKPENLLFHPSFQKELADRQEAWRRLLTKAISRGISTPTISASLAFYDALRSGRLPANLTQAQRDFFGAHTYQRTDREGVFHTRWNGA